MHLLITTTHLAHHILPGQTTQTFFLWKTKKKLLKHVEMN